MLGRKKQSTSLPLALKQRVSLHRGVLEAADGYGFCAQHAQSVDARLVLCQHAGGESNQNCLILQFANYEAG